jgi:hypothetical protein
VFGAAPLVDIGTPTLIKFVGVSRLFLRKPHKLTVARTGLKATERLSYGEILMNELCVFELSRWARALAEPIGRGLALRRLV